MVDFLGVIRKAANKVTDAAGGGETAASTGTKFSSSIRSAEQTAANNNGPTQPRTLVADRVTEQKQANRFIGEGGDVNIRPVLLNSGGGVTDFGVQVDEQAEVERSADRIEGLLDAGGAFQWVTKGEVTEVTEIFADLDDAEQYNALFDELENRGLVDDLVREIYDQKPGNNGSLPDDTRRAFYNDLGSKLDADNLISMIDELKAVSEGGDVDPVSEFSDGIAQHESDDVKLEFVRRNAEGNRLGDDHAFYTSFLAPHGPVDPDSLAVAKVISSLRGNSPAISEAMELLSDSQLNDVISSTLAPLDGRHPAPLEVRTAPDYVGLASAINSIDSSTPMGAKQVSRFVSSSIDQLENSKALQLNPQFKDDLTFVFNQHFDNILANAINPDNNVVSSSFYDDITSFSRYVAFGDSPGRLQNLSSDLIIRNINQLVDLAEGGHPIEGTESIGAAALDRELARVDVAGVAGEILGASLEGLDAALNDKANKAAAQRAGTDFLVDLIFSAAPNVVGSSVKAAYGAGAERVYNTLEGRAENALKDELKEALAADFDIDAGGFVNLRNEIGDAIASDVDLSDEPHLKDDLSDAFKVGVELEED